MAYWEALLRACNPSILSNQSALFQQEHISTVTVGSFTTSGVGWGQEGVAWKESERTILMFWHEVFRSTPHPAFLLIQVSERAVGQSLLASIFDCDVLDANVHHCTRLVSFFLSHSLSKTNFFSFSLLFLSSRPSSPVQQWEVSTAVSQQPWVQVLAPIGPVVAVVVKGPGAGLLSPVQVCSIIYLTNNNMRNTTLSPRTLATLTAQRIRLWVQ